MIEQDDPGRPQIVFPGDNRVRIDPTKVNPYWWVGEIECTFPNGTTASGTGTLIGERSVLTCAHLLYQSQFGGDVTGIKFALARNGNKHPYKIVTSKLFGIPELFRKSSPPIPNKYGEVGEYTKYMYDYAVIRLDESLEPDGITYPAIQVASNSELGYRKCDIAGYPGDKSEGTMWNGSGELSVADSQEFLFYQISTYNGQSGAAVRSLFPKLVRPEIPRIVGIHVAGSEQLNSNFAVRINENVFGDIMRWM